ncbi:unnamed protein product [Bursaphelenchus okinawaensis]|uniref:Uncharacterized protein n=1 Tax=Bursaphelenchus okinawaensis TaxID=465554 RepID=A0A811LKC9_9BILA|nr:unnamed protein product [Bursaphelenchus okinawaensis]CAG9127465.1 unnamed protein product [Bursaphelenchus okinawaensis]
MTPWSAMSSDMQKVIHNLLDIRRGKYPAKEFIRSDCSQPRNVSALKKQDCALSYCETLILTDHNTASSFTIRGCAEKLGAIDDSYMERRGDNVCKKLHNSVDIQECICKNRKYCYTGPQRRNLGYSEEAEASFLAPQARSSGVQAYLSSFAIILYMLLLL